MSTPTMSPNTKKWHAAHYNAIAKDIRELYPGLESNDVDRNFIHGYRRGLENLAVRLAVRFKADSDQSDEGLIFDPVRFLDQCSPDTDLYPLGELWQDD